MFSETNLDSANVTTFYEAIDRAQGILFDKNLFHLFT